MMTGEEAANPLTQAGPKAAVYGRDPNWGRIACAVGYAGIHFNINELRTSLGDILLMNNGQPLPFDRYAASTYLRQAGDTHGTVKIDVSVVDNDDSRGSSTLFFSSRHLREWSWKIFISQKA